MPAGHEPAENAVFFLRPFFSRFDRLFFRTRDRYVETVERSFSRKLRYFVIYVLIVAAVGVLFLRMPTAYVPDEDQGILLAQVMLPTGATLEQTRKVVDEVQRYFQENEKEAVESCMTIAGVRLFRQGADQRHGIYQAQGLEAPRPGGPEGEGRCGTGHEGLFSASATPWCSPSRRLR